MNKKLKTSIIFMAIVFSTAYAEGVSNKCIGELIELPNTKENFNMESFPKDLATVVLKVQGTAKFQTIPLLGSMLGPGSDDQLTEAGITVGCAKEMPTDVGEIKSLLMKVGLEMGKSAVAGKLGIKRTEIPNNVGELKGFAVKIATVKTSEALGINASEVPTDIKGMESLISENIKTKAAKKLGVEKSSIPKDKGELSGFVKKAAKAKIADELGIKPAEVSLDRASLAEYAKKEESLAPVANLVNAANILEILGLVNQLSALTGSTDVNQLNALTGGTDINQLSALTSGTDTSTAIIATAKADEGDEEEKPVKKKAAVEEDDEDEVPKAKDKKKKESEKETRFGIRGNFGRVIVYPNTVQYQYNDAFGSHTTTEAIEGGPVYGLGAFILIPVVGIYFVPEMSIQHRTPVLDFFGLTITENVIESSLLFRFRYREENMVYVSFGPFIGAIVNVEDNIDGTFKNYRSGLDYGLILELGFRINNNFSIDLRAIGSYASLGITEYLTINGLSHAQLGVSFVF
jgi:hypothetical protein